VRTDEDAYGRAVLDHLEGRASFEIVERDDGYVGLSAGPPAYFAPYRRWPRPERAAARFAQGRVLDVGCGAGRWALHLQERGHDVLGIDLSPLAIRVCRRRGLRQARVLSVTQISRSLGVFDTIVMMGNNFGLLGGVRRGRWLLRRLYGMTSQNARIIAESRDYSVQVGEHRSYHLRNRRRGRLPGQLRIRVRYRSYTTPWFDYLLASKKDMQSILEGTGWQVRKFLDSDGPLYVAVIEKTSP
jgi:hypothetical protein